MNEQTAQLFDLAVVGGGPAGAAASVYAARKQLHTIFLTQEWGGQSTVSPDIQNWIGTPSISGNDLAKNLRAHVEAYSSDVVTIVSPSLVTTLVADTDSITITSKKGISYKAKALLIATGSTRRKLDIPGAEMYDNKGLTYCATCDGPLYGDKDVVVVGGGNAALETALQLLAYSKSVTLLNRTETVRADPITLAAALRDPKFTLIKNAVPTEVVGAHFVTGITYKDVISSAETHLAAEGIFVEIGLIPNTDWLADVVTLTESKQVVVDPLTQRTSHPRIWAAGDVTNGLYHQNNIAAGDAVKALEDIYISLKKLG